MVGEGLVTPIILRVADKYVEGLDAKQLELNLSSGVATLNNVQLRREAIDELDLPFHLHRGVCRQVKITLPGITSMISKPWIIEIDQLMLNCLCPLEKPFSEKEERDRVHRAKMALVEAFEAKRREKLAAKDGSDTKSAGFVSRQVEVITNNAIVKVKAVHFRYESRVAKTVFGAVLSDVHAQTTDDAGHDAFLDPSKADRVIKGIRFEGLRVYCESSAGAAGIACPDLLLDEPDKAKWVAAMQRPFSAPAAGGGAPTVQDASAMTVFGPVVGDASLTMMFKSFVKKALDTPYVQLKVSLDNLVAHLTRAQYVGVLTVLSQWSNWSLVMPFRRYRPEVPVRGNAKLWWKYAFNVVNRHRFVAWKEKVSPNFRHMYMDAFDSKLQRHNGFGDATLSDEEVERRNEARVTAIERLMTAKDIVECRKEVYKTISENLKELIARKEKAARSAGWFSGWSKSKEQQREEKLIEELRGTWGIVPEQEQAIDTELEKLPPTYCNLDARLHLPAVGVTIVMSDQPMPCAVRLHHTTVAFKQFNAPQSFEVIASADDLTMTNPTASHAYVPFVVCKQPDGSTASREISGAEPLLKVRFNSKPVVQPIPGTKLDAQGSVQLRPLRVIADPPLLRRLQKFFTVPRGIDVSGITNSTSQVASAVSNMASAQVASAIGGSMTIDFLLDVGAPIFILPKHFASASRDMDALCVSLGHFKFKSNPLTDSEKQRRIADAGATTTANKLHRYYHNVAACSNLFVSITNLGDVLADVTRGFQVVPNITCEAAVYTRMIPTDTSNETVIVQAEVPTMALQLSIHQAFLLTSLTDAWFGRGPSPTATSMGKSSQSQQHASLISNDSLADDSMLGSTVSDGSFLRTMRADAASGADPAALLMSIAASDSEEDETGAAASTPSQPGVKVIADDPVVAVDLTVSVFGLLIFDDDARTKRPQPEHRFDLIGEPLTVTHRGRVRSSRTTVQLASLKCTDSKIPASAAIRDEPVSIISGNPLLSCDVVIPDSTELPKSVDIGLGAGLVCHVGTPLAEMLEMVMDVVNLFTNPAPASAPSASAEAIHAAASTAVPAAAVDAPAYRVAGQHVAKTSAEKDASPLGDKRTMVLSIRIDSAGVTLYNPSPTQGDVIIAQGSVARTWLRIDMRQRTMDVTGGVGEVDLTYHKVEGQDTHAALAKEPTIRVLHGGSSLPNAEDLVAFSYVTTQPQAPVVYLPRSTESHEPMRLDRSRPLEFSNFLTVSLQPAHVVYDAFTVMVLLNYFTVGFISRFAALGGRKRYDGREAFVPPPGLQMLTSIDIHVRSPSVELPLNDGRGKVLSATLGNLHIFNSIKPPSAECASPVAKTKIALDGMELVDPESKIAVIRRTGMTITMVNPLDPSARIAPQLLLDMQDVVLAVDPSQYIDVLNLLCRNILHMPQSSSPPPPAADKRSTPPPAAPADTTPQSQTFIRAKSIALRCFSGSGANASQLFSVVLSAPLISMIRKDIKVSWTAIEIVDEKPTVAGTAAQKLFVCDRADVVVSKEDPTVMQTIVDFSVRRLAVTNQWFDVVDWLVTRPSLTALAPLLGGGSGADAAAQAASGPFVGTKVVVTSREFVIPLLNARNEHVMQIALSKLEFRYEQSSGTQSAISAKLQSVELRHVQQDFMILSCQPIAQGAANRGLLDFSMKSDAGAKTSDIDLSLSGLNMMLVMPVLYEVIHYATHPDQPLAQLPKLATVQDQRDAVATKQSATRPEDRTTMRVSVNWARPTITVPINARWTASTDFMKAASLRADLGHISADLSMGGASGAMKLKTRMERATIADLLEETTMIFTYDSAPASQSKMSLGVEPVGVIVSHVSLRNVLAMLADNINLPQPKHTVVAPTGEPAAASPAATPTSQLSIAVKQARLKLCDQANAHFLDLCVNDFSMCQDGVMMEIGIAAITGVDVLTGIVIMRSGGSSGSSVTVRSDSRAHRMDVELDNTEFTVLPEAIGRTIDLFLSPMSTSGESASAPRGDTPPSDAGHVTTPADSGSTAPFHTYVTIRKSSFDIMRSGTVIAVLSLDDSSVHLVALPDGSSTTDVAVGPISLLDRVSKETLYPVVLESIEDSKQATGAERAKFIEVLITNEAPLPPSAPRSPNARFAQHIKASISSVSFVYVPELIAALSAAGVEAGEKISHSDKAKQRAASTADAIMNEAQALKRIDIKMERPRVVLISDTASTECIEIFPGGLHVSNSLEVEAGGEQVEVFTGKLEGMQISVLGAPAFHHDKPLTLGSRFALRPPLGSRSFVNIPTLEMRLDEPQLLFLFRFCGAVMRPTKKPAAAILEEHSHQQQQLESKPAAKGATGTAAPATTGRSTVTVTLGELGVSISDKFLISAQSTELSYASQGDSGTAGVQLTSFMLNHKSTVLFSLVDSDVKQKSDPECTEVIAHVGDSLVCLTPQAVREFMDVIYKPLCKHLLHSSHEPIAKFTLGSATSVTLADDLTLDAYGYLLVSNTVHSTFELDLGGHDLFLSGTPAPMIILEDHCILTITNGRILIEGAYSLSSFVHYSHNSALHLAETCIVKKFLFNGATAAVQRPRSMTIASANQQSHVDPAAPVVSLPGVPVVPDVEPQQTTMVLRATFNTTIQLINETDNTPDLGFVLGGKASYMQVNVGSKVEKRNIAATIDKLTTLDPLMLRTTSLELNAFGDESLHMDVFLPRFDFTVRVMRVKRIMDTVNRITAALSSSSAASVDTALPGEQPRQYTTRIEFEDLDNFALFVTSKRGRCKYCHVDQAYLANTSARSMGIVCYRCGFGRANNNVPTIDAKISAIDLLLVGADGEMIELIAEKVHGFVNRERKIFARALLESMVYNRKYAVWEPILEQSGFEFDGKLDDNTWNFTGQRIFLVPSVFSLGVVQSVAGQFNSTIEQSVIPARITNYTSDIIWIDESILVEPNKYVDVEMDRAKRLFTMTHNGITVDVTLDSTSFVASSESITEVDVRRNSTEVRILPFHSSGGIVRVVSEVGVALRLEGSRTIEPNSMLYLPASVSLENPFLIQPIGIVGDDFLQSDPGSGMRIPQFIDILRGYRPTLHSISAHDRGVSMHFKPHCRSDGSASGVPIFSIVVSGSLVAHNVSPCTVSLQMMNARTGGEIGTVVIEPGEKTHLYHGENEDHYKFSMQVAQGRAVYASGLFRITDDPMNIVLRSESRAEMVLQVAIADGVIAISTPFAIANHTILPLTCVDSNRRGSTNPTNYADLAPQADYLVPVTPLGGDPDELFALFGFDKFRTIRETPLHVLDQVNIIELIDTTTRDTMQLCCRTTMNSTGTRVVTITPRWVVCNKTSRQLHVAQDLGTSCINTMRINKGATHHYYPGRVLSSTAKAAERDFRMVVSLDADSTSPGEGFAIDAHFDAFFLARARDPSVEPFTVAVTVVPQDSYTYIVLEDPKEAPYLFVNRTPFAVDLVDSFAARRLLEAPPHSVRAIPYVSRIAADEVIQIARDVIKAKVHPSGAELLLDLKHQVAFNESDKTLGLAYTVTRGSGGQTIVTLQQTLPLRTSCILPMPPQPLVFVARINVLSVSIVNHPIEVAHAVFNDIVFKVDRSGSKEIVSFSIFSYQIDNQTEEAPPYPSAVCPIRSPKSKSPSIAFQVERQIVAARSMLVIPRVVINFDEISIRVSDGFLVRIVQLLKAINNAPDAPPKCPSEADLHKIAPSQLGLMASQVIVGEMVVNPIFVRLWLQRERDVDFLVDTMAQSKMLSLMAVSLNDVKITVPGIAEKDQRHRAFTLINKLKDIYVTKIYNGMGAVLLQYASAIPLIGAPIKAVTDIGSGAIHFFTDPIEGITESPEAFAKGVARGTTHLVGGVIGGAFGAISNVTSTVAKGASLFEGGRAKQSNRKQPRTNTFTGIGKGLTGLFTKPVEGLAEEGAAGLAKGLGRGVVGLVASPLSGLMNDVASVTGTVAELVTGDYIEKVKRMRPLRLFHAGGGIAVFGTVIETFQYHRKYHGDKWVASMLDTKDGPRWNPGTKEQLAERHGVAEPVWFVDKVASNFDGWQHSDDYYGPFHMMPEEDDLVRRRRWVLVIRERTSSSIIPEMQRIVLVAPEGSPTSSFASTAFSSRSLAQRSAVGGSSPNFGGGGGGGGGGGVSATPLTPSTTSFAVASTVEQNVRIVETYENQRWYPVRGWTSHLLPTDRPNWSTRDGSGRPRPKDSFDLEPGWEWADEWKVAGGDANGWEYAVDFPQQFIQKDKTGYCVRRRCWRRTMKKK